MPKRCETMFRNIGMDDRMWDRFGGEADIGQLCERRDL
jgi:hypothetical protein